jgi:hypothetical protein
VRREAAAVNGRGQIVREIFIIGAQFLILASFVALVIFYGLVFWHWRNDAKQRGVRHRGWPSSIAGPRPAK